MPKTPDGWHTLTPRLFADDPARLIAFLRTVFGATGEVQTERPSELRIGDSMLMVGDTRVRAAMPAFLYVYVDDADATWRAAIDAGARSLEDPLDTPYGDRRGMVEDAWGNVWQIATRRGA